MEDLKDKNNLEYEFDGKTVAEAVKKAVSFFKTEKKNLRIKVVSEEQMGLFGMGGAKPARIVVTSKDQKTKKKLEYPR